MIADGVWPWVVLALLGAYHGLNPAMGWLFAVGLGLQDRSRRAVVSVATAAAVRDIAEQVEHIEQNGIDIHQVLADLPVAEQRRARASHFPKYRTTP